jgi:hypothetical protein
MRSSETRRAPATRGLLSRSRPRALVVSVALLAVATGNSTVRADDEGRAGTAQAVEVDERHKVARFTGRARRLVRNDFEIFKPSSRRLQQASAHVFRNGLSLTPLRIQHQRA